MSPFIPIFIPPTPKVTLLVAKVNPGRVTISTLSTAKVLNIPA